MGVSAKNAGFEILGSESLRIKLHDAAGFAEHGHARHDLQIVILQSHTALHRRFLQGADRHIELHFEFGHTRSLAFFQCMVEQLVEGRAHHNALHIGQGAARLCFHCDVKIFHTGHGRLDLVPCQLRRARQLSCALELHSASLVNQFAVERSNCWPCIC